MTTRNIEVSKIFDEVADFLEIQGANPFRVRAYRNAARTIADLGKSIAEMADRKKDLKRLSGIGDNLAEKIQEIAQTGSLKQLERLKNRMPSELNELLKVPGLGPKRIQSLYLNLDITDLGELKQAAEKKKIREIHGFGKKMEQSILDSIRNSNLGERRISLYEAEKQAESLVRYLNRMDGIHQVSVAGSYRRRKETIGDLDILVACEKASDVMDRFSGYEDVHRVISKGKTRSSVVLKSGLHVDLRVISQAGFGAGLHYFTGSRAHNIAVRKRGMEKNLKINEYGVFRDKQRLAGKTEKDVYAMVDLAYIEPELREDQGEIEAAEKGRLPKLIKATDIRGDLHCHTDVTDGRDSIENMAQAAIQRGYEYLAITDHSKKVTMAKGLGVDQLAKQIQRINGINEKLDELRLLKGIEVDILEEGSLDLPDEILKQLDLCVCSVHYRQNLSLKKQTRRIQKAMENPYVNILAHPTGRIIGRRNSYAVEMKEIMRAALENRCFLELNCDPDRLDLNATHCRMAKEMGVKIAVSTDAHSTAGLGYIRYGIDQARRGWLETEDVINTRNHENLMKLLKRD